MFVDRTESYIVSNESLLGGEPAPRVVATTRAPHEIASRIVILLNTLTTDEIRNQLLYV